MAMSLSSLALEDMMLPRSVNFGAIFSFVKPVETENVRYFWFGTGKGKGKSESF